VSREVRAKAELVARLIDEMIETTTVTIMFHQAIADRLGMNITDHKCAGILMRSGPISAGELARRTGLTTGAITGVIDRLERAGFARRARDADDRRKVMIEPNLKRIERKIVPLFDSMGRSAAQVFERYSAEELTLILDFAVRSRQMAEDEVRKVREAPVPANSGKGRRSSRASIKS
jgi:DNA-binding MarR family transcriptional regulator